MKYYEKLLDLGCFDRKRLVSITGSEAAAASLIYNYQKKGYIERVRRDFYAVISMETKQPLLSRYQLGSQMFPDACITHHSAFELYGYANQVFYELYLATDCRFSDFEYDGILYHRIERKKEMDVAQNGLVRFTGLEQTVVDSIRDFEKIAGLEEVTRCIMLVPGLREEKLLEVLERNRNLFLYQKCGYILEQLREGLSLSNAFFQECEKHFAAAKRSLLKDSSRLIWNPRWHLYAPESLGQLLNKGVSDYDAV